MNYEARKKHVKALKNITGTIKKEAYNIAKDNAEDEV